MTKSFKILILCLVVGVISYLLYHITITIQNNKYLAENIASIPQFSFTTLNQQTFSKQNLPDTLGKVIIELFSPDCEHCKYMAKTLVANKDRFRDTEIIMITPFGDSASVSEFIKTYQLTSLVKAHFLLDKKFDFPNIFGTSVVPSFFIYDNNKLVRQIKGETKIENLLD